MRDDMENMACGPGSCDPGPVHEHGEWLLELLAIGLRALFGRAASFGKPPDGADR